MQPFEPSELKALFGQLVDAVGTQEAAGIFLGISRQRVGQLISTANPSDLPNVAQIYHLEQVVGTSIVFAALARKAESRGQRDALAAGVSCMTAASAAVATLHEVTRDGVITEDEAERAEDDARRALEAAQAQFDAARALRRGNLKAVS